MPDGLQMQECGGVKMTDHKFTDEEVIKALKHCASETSSKACVGCPFDENGACIDSENAMAIYALSLINRQKEEIDAMKIANEKMYAAAKEQEAEIERLEGALKAEERHNQLTMEIAQKAIENAKDKANKDLQAEIADKDKAIKNALEIISIGEKPILEVGASWIEEFAKFLIDNSTEGLIAISDLPDLVKEMTEGKAHEMQSTDQP
jgi:hypothetical protein